MIETDIHKLDTRVPANCTRHALHPVPEFHACVKAPRVSSVDWGCISPYPGEISNVEVFEEEGFVVPGQVVHVRCISEGED